MRIASAWVTLFLVPAAAAQTAQTAPAAPAAPNQSSALEWAVALRSRYDLFREPVVSVSATAQLALLVCAVDRSAAAGLYQEAFRGLGMLTPQRFVDARHMLPAPSFTALWKSITENARKCDPSLEQYFDSE